MYQQLRKWNKQVTRTHRIWEQDLKFAEAAVSEQFLKKWEEKKRDRFKALELRRSQLAAKNEKTLQDELDRVKSVKTQQSSPSTKNLAKNLAKWYSWVEKFRPADYVRENETAAEKMSSEAMEKAMEKYERDRIHSEFMIKIREEKEMELKERMEREGEDFNFAENEKKGLQEPLFPYAKESTELVAGPKKKGWEKMKESLGSFSPKSSKLYQKGLEFKERLEDSENVVVAKTMDSLGAAADLGRSGVKKISGETETAASLRKIKEVWPHFDTNQWWSEQVRRLPATISAFHERDYTYIQQNSNPIMFEILAHKSNELCKSQVNPGENSFRSKERNNHL